MPNYTKSITIDKKKEGDNMITEERYKKILQLVNATGTVAIADLIIELGASESTVRRDLVNLDNQNLLKKCYGGAVAINSTAFEKDAMRNARKEINLAAKTALAAKAASLINDGDMVYIDAGTTTELISQFIQAKNVTVVTNGLNHIKTLLNRDIDVIIVGGKVKPITEAIVGAKVVDELERYHFNVGFFGANGVSTKMGYVTPEVEEAQVKRKALGNCATAYVVADESKLSKYNFVSFANLADAVLITNAKEIEDIAKQTNVIYVG